MSATSGAGDTTGEPAPPDPDPTHRAESAGGVDATPGASPVEQVPAPVVDLAILGDALRSAARGASELARALGDIEAAVAAATDPGRQPGRGSADAGIDGDARHARREGSRAEAGGQRHRRVPLALPGGVLDDSVEAAEHLLRSPGVLLLVDGYNVTMTGWPELTVGEQRRRLLGALGEAAARTGAAVEVVFDGADIEVQGVSRQVRQLVRVRFSPPDVEADDVLLELLALLPASRPVVVASSDRRVRDGARRQGANVVHARQLVGLLRR